MKLGPDTVLFKFVVDNEWVCAPNYKKLSDGFGGWNNEVEIRLPSEGTGTRRNMRVNEDRTDAPHSPPSTNASVRQVTRVQIHHHDLDDSTADIDLRKEAESDTHKEPSVERAQTVSHVESNQPTTRITFAYPCDDKDTKVHIRGSWDGWETPFNMELSDEGQTWRTILELPAGRFIFKFVVDEHWTHSALYEIESDGYGGFNNVVSVSAPDSQPGHQPDSCDSIDTLLQPLKSRTDEETGVQLLVRTSSGGTKQDDVQTIAEAIPDDNDGGLGNATSSEIKETGDNEEPAEHVTEVQLIPKHYIERDQQLVSVNVEILEKLNFSSQVFEMVDNEEESKSDKVRANDSPFIVSPEPEKAVDASGMPTFESESVDTDIKVDTDVNHLPRSVSLETGNEDEAPGPISQAVSVDVGANHSPKNINPETGDADEAPGIPCFESAEDVNQVPSLKVEVGEFGYVGPIHRRNLGIPSPEYVGVNEDPEPNLDNLSNTVDCRGERLRKTTTDDGLGEMKKKKSSRGCTTC
ncbi:unnamed protein product [Agarophyton chilense]